MNHYISPKDVSMQRTAAGAGLSTAWRCFGCHTDRSQLGSKGQGVFKRCASCVAKMGAK